MMEKLRIDSIFEKLQKDTRELSKKIDVANKIFKEADENMDFTETPKSDWKILNVNDLSDCPDIFVGDYDFQSLELKTDWPVCWNKVKEYKILTILKNIEDGFFKYRYRITPTKKTHEELAEEYVENLKISIPVSYSYSDSLKMITACRISFIAGRKSMEEEK